MASPKIKTACVPVVKHLEVKILRSLGERQKREFLEEFSAKIAQGYKVFAFAKTHDGVTLQLGKTEDWTMDELMSECQELLERCR